MPSWSLQAAQARLSEVVELAEREGPQEITVNGRVAAVLLSAREYARLRGAFSGSLLEFMRKSPLYGSDEPGFVRDPGPARRHVAL